ncbi:MAG: hypothetical protein JETT_2796 [Candidatus Jettenia ecosi]|uniref:Uncharacterized protein n=1 Tax=Candidatus Jettenia ecosi TaxID=2494326 RepID=A0A533Q9J0_9BACT|nr:MAG: hypothetical protein JETT_2796 [Candidatus Jettenia ecosi]
MDMDYKTLTNKVCQCHPRNQLTEYEKFSPYTPWRVQVCNLNPQLGIFPRC